MGATAVVYMIMGMLLYVFTEDEHMKTRWWMLLIAGCVLMVLNGQVHK